MVRPQLDSGDSSAIGSGRKAVTGFYEVKPGP
jgi:hypothetical protein